MNVAKLRKSLLSWFELNKRDLPFRKSKDPYKIWLSEIMLQQTTMAVVVPYFERFVRKFPTIAAVAKSKDDNLLNAWKGLGYYARIRNLKLACREVCEKYGGKLPKDFNKIRALKGVGDYTTAAIASICFNLPHAVIDGNVKRVLARLFHFRENTDTTRARGFFKEKAETLLDRKSPGDFNQALMELGATVCTKSPHCLICPLNQACASFGKDPENLPIKTKMRFRPVDYSSLILHNEDKILLKKPSSENLIKDMWELPSCYAGSVTHHIDSIQKRLPVALNKKKLQRMGSVKHSITDKRIKAHVFGYELRGRLSGRQLTKWTKGDLTFIAWEELQKIPLNTLARKALQKFSPWSKN